MLYSKKLFVCLCIYVERYFPGGLSPGTDNNGMRSLLILQRKLNKTVSETLKNLFDEMHCQSNRAERSGLDR